MRDNAGDPHPAVVPQTPAPRRGPAHPCRAEPGPLRWREAAAGQAAGGLQPVAIGQPGDGAERRPPSIPGCRSLPLLAALLLAPSLAGSAALAEGQVQLNCAGTLLEARGQAETRRATATLKTSLSLEAEAPTADQALGLLQQRLASVRSALQQLQVADLRVTSPSTWQRPAERGRPAVVQANLQVSGNLAPSRLQELIRTVGALPGVRLAPVGTEADRREDAKVRVELLRQAYADALRQVQPLAELIGQRRLRALEIRVDGMEMPMPMLRGMAASAPPPFDPAELNQPLDRLGMQVRFCAE